MNAISDVQQGPVALFDILGYQEFLENNDPKTAAQRVRSVLDKLVGLQDEMLLQMMKDREILQGDVQERPRWLVFSDTVLITLDVSKIKEVPSQPESLGENIELHWYVFLLQCIALWRSLFEFGLPVRGAITQGPYLVEDACFAGKPIVQAYRLANDLNCAGVAIDNSVAKWCQGTVGPGVFYFDYLFPSKTKGFVQTPALNLLYSLHERQEIFTKGIRQRVHASFWAHNKQVGPGVAEKIENTERLLRFLKTKSKSPPLGV